MNLKSINLSWIFLAPHKFVLSVHFVDFLLGSDTFQSFDVQTVRGRFKQSLECISHSERLQQLFEAKDALGHIIIVSSLLPNVP